MKLVFQLQKGFLEDFKELFLEDYSSFIKDSKSNTKI